MKLRRSWPERLFIAIGMTFILGVSITSMYADLDGWDEIVPWWLSSAASGVALGQFIYNTKPRPLCGRAMWVGPIDGFVAAYADGAEPFRKWGITRDQRVEVRIVFDTVDEAFDSYIVNMTPTATGATAGLAGQPAGGVVAVDAVGGDVVSAASDEDNGKPTSSTGGPPAGA